MRDPYQTLGVDRGATDADIKAAFRRAAVQHHPDRNPGDPSAQDRFKEVNQAYQILSDPQKRAAFDRYGPAAFQPGGAGPGAGVGFVDLSNLDGIFGDILGAFGFRTPDRGDLRTRVRVSFEEAAVGCDKQVTYERLDLCGRCGGRGGEPDAPIEVCSACNGMGRVRFQQGIFPIAVERPCSRCRGRGRIPTNACQECHGDGLTKSSRTIEVGIPAGVESGASRLVEGGGHRTSAQRPPGDLEIVIEVEPHPFFKRMGDDVVCAVPISFVQAALGSEVDVPTLDGKAKLRVPPSTQPGAVLRLKGKGIPHRVRGGRGDQLVQISLEVPTELTPRARELIEQLGKELGEEVQPQKRTFAERLKDLFG